MLVPYLVSEREPGGWEDCVWCTGVMLGNVYVGEIRFPATRTEYEGLRYDATGVREASGDGSNYRELEDGLHKRYAIPVVRRGSGFDAAMVACPVGSALAAQGLYRALPARLKLTSFTGGHSALFLRDQATSGLWLDPLAANGATPTRITLQELRAYYEALPGGEWIAAFEREAYSQPMIRFDIERWRLPAGTPVFESPNGLQITKFGSQVDVTTIGAPNAHVPGGVDWHWRALLVTTSALDGAAVMKVAFIRRPVGSPLPTDPAWDAAVVKALLDPTFRGGSVVHAEAAEIAAARKAGVLDGIKLVDADVEKLKLANA